VLEHTKCAGLYKGDRLHKSLKFNQNLYYYNLSTFSNFDKSRDSVVGIATVYGVEDGGSRIFFSPRRLNRLWGPPSLLSNYIGSSFPRVKQPGREAHH
jgi:hypothetical protein